MKLFKMALLIVVDLVLLLFLLLLLSYYGMSHLAMFAMAIFFLFLTVYDLKSGALSTLFSGILGLEDSAGGAGRLRWLPVVLSVLLLALSLPVLLEHGLVNSAQRWAMQQQGQFLRLAVPAVVGGALVIAVALWTLFAGGKKKG